MSFSLTAPYGPQTVSIDMLEGPRNGGTKLFTPTMLHYSYEIFDLRKQKGRNALQNLYHKIDQMSNLI